MLGQTAYMAYHDRAVAEGEQRRQDLIAKAAGDTAKLAKSKAAWYAATRDLIGQLGVSFLKESIEKPPKRTDTSVGEISVKVFAASDVTWHDARNVTVQGFVISKPFNPPKSIPPGGNILGWEYFPWSRDLVLLDDDSWGASRTVTFRPASLSNDERSAMFTVELKP